MWLLGSGMTCVLTLLPSWFPRSVEEVGEAGVPGSGQRWQDHSPTHAQGQQNGPARPHTTPQ